MNRPLVRPADQRAFDATVLIAESNFQMQHLLTVTLKTEMTGLDNARVDRPDCNFVNLFARDLKKIRHARQCRRVKANRLQPGMRLRDHAALLCNLALDRKSTRLNSSH